MYQHNPNINKSSQNEDVSLKAIALLLNGFPIKVKGKELVLLDKLYERVDIRGEPSAVVSSVTLSEIPFIIANIDEEEVNFIVESYRYNRCDKSKTKFVTAIVSSLIKDFSELKDASLEINEYYDRVTLEKYSSPVPIMTKISSNSKISFSSDTLKMKGKRINRIDSVWNIDIPDKNNKFIWGFGIDLNMKITPPDCKIGHSNEFERDMLIPSL
ncbi:hypothetical protein [Psychromonas sp. SP041]|uniref:hypothetical protein n=1 Tax=Psychromonas sp. SP041 TaxID=1365007 RepID=UPI0010C7BEBA|nr:hypothetical protein [Psychromonas sp. SP041]